MRGGGLVELMMMLLMGFPIMLSYMLWLAHMLFRFKVIRWHYIMYIYLSVWCGTVRLRDCMNEL